MINIASTFYYLAESILLKIVKPDSLQIHIKAPDDIR